MEDTDRETPEARRSRIINLIATADCRRSLIERPDGLDFSAGDADELVAQLLRATAVLWGADGVVTTAALRGLKKLKTTLDNDEESAAQQVDWFLADLFYTRACEAYKLPDATHLERAVYILERLDDEGAGLDISGQELGELLPLEAQYGRYGTEEGASRAGKLTGLIFHETPQARKRRAQRGTVADPRMFEFGPTHTEVALSALRALGVAAESLEEALAALKPFLEESEDGV